MPMEQPDYLPAREDDWYASVTVIHVDGDLGDCKFFSWCWRSRVERSQASRSTNTCTREDDLRDGVPHERLGFATASRKRYKFCLLRLVRFEIRASFMAIIGCAHGRW